MPFPPGWVFVVGAIAVLLVGWARYGHYRWQESVDRERFVLAMKAASTPNRLDPGERARLHLIRAPWWAVWRWLPERWGKGDERRSG